MKVADKKFDEFEASIERTMAYLEDCLKASKELRERNTLSESGIPDDFVSLSACLSDAAINRTFQAILDKEPNKITHVTNRKTCIFV